MGCMHECAHTHKPAASPSSVSSIERNEETHNCTHTHTQAFYPDELDDACVRKLLDASRIPVQPYKMWFSVWSTENMKWQILKYKMHKHIRTCTHHVYIVVWRKSETARTHVCV